MDGSTGYIIDITLFTMAAFFLAYIVYGRVTHKPLIAAHKYKPGKPGYEVFRKIVDSQKYLVGTIFAIIFFLANALLDAYRILKSDSSHSILIVVPVIVLGTLVILISLLPKFFPDK